MFGLNSLWHWIVLLALVLLLFGTGKLRHAGRDLGSAMAGFRKAMREDLADATPVRSPRNERGDQP